MKDSCKGSTCNRCRQNGDEMDWSSQDEVAQCTHVCRCGERSLMDQQSAVE
ncbi:hypothetical protein P7K49_036869 [Saguinus oedipus]|uniref:Uncharacterized protein n=1 Tax=Saguinus oedipus TaxID=9490 RepID=A0ABQ9TLJ2_SAGOE|nr:hypothetical protein P7K49_036869 [Saguinus oedipus]